MACNEKNIESQYLEETNNTNLLSSLSSSDSTEIMITLAGLVGFHSQTDSITSIDAINVLIASNGSIFAQFQFTGIINNYDIVVQEYDGITNGVTKKTLACDPCSVICVPVIGFDDGATCEPDKESKCDEGSSCSERWSALGTIIINHGSIGMIKLNQLGYPAFQYVNQIN